MISRKSMILGVAALLVVCTLSIVSTEAGDISEIQGIKEEVTSGGGNGTVEDPYLITNVWELQNMSENLTAHYALADDINASITDGWNGGEGFVPIGNNTDTFKGTFDGRNHTITSLYTNKMMDEYRALFGFIESGSSVTNVGLEDVYAEGNYYTASLAGYNEGTVSNSYSSGHIECRTGFGGGLVGENKGTVNNSYSTADISSTLGSYRMGGLVGQNMGIIENSYATGAARGSQNVGGLLGYNYGTVLNSYSTSRVIRESTSSYTTFGGFVGYNYQHKVINCYSTGRVIYESSTDPTDKGFCGGVDTAGNYEMRGNFWDVNTSYQTSTGGNATGKSTAEMKTQSTFTDENWDFNKVWHMLENITYPLLRWQGVFNKELWAGGEADGWNFISFNVIPRDTSLEAVLDDPTYGISGNYDKVFTAQPRFMDVYDVLFSDDIENGTGGWTTDGNNTLWNITDNRYHSFNHSWAYNDGADYDIGDITNGTLTSPWIDVMDYHSSVLSYQSWVETENSSGFDLYSLQVKTDVEGWIQIFEDYRSDTIWHKEEYNLEDHVDIINASSIKIRFSFDSVDQFNNKFEGWYIDDIEVTGIKTEVSKKSVVWGSYVPGRASQFNDLDCLDRSMGIWIHMINDDNLTIVGSEPIETNITLQPGWNMVGYPCMTSKKANTTLPPEVDKIAYFYYRAPYYLIYEQDLSSINLDPGEGYWIYNGADEAVVWNVGY